MRRISMAMRDELLKAATERYAHGDRTEKSRILDEFVAVSEIGHAGSPSVGVASSSAEAASLRR